MNLARGVELFDGGQPWEAHEVWEDLWRVAPPGERERLAGLIQAAAAVVQAQRGRWRGVERLVARAVGNLGGGAFADALVAWGARVVAAERYEPPPRLAGNLPAPRPSKPT